MESPLLNLQTWYQTQCDGDWEHQNGIRIETLDNPGWYVKIDLTHYPTSKSEMVLCNIDQPVGWMRCLIKKGFFEGFCGPTGLEDVLNIFLDWVSRNKTGD
jgi:hypothetical protein